MFHAYLFNNSMGILPRLVGNNETRKCFHMSICHNSMGIMPDLIGNHDTRRTSFYLQINRSSCPPIYEYIETPPDLIVSNETRHTCIYLQRTGFT